LLDAYDYDLAKKFVERALQIDPDSVKALQHGAAILIEVSRRKEGKKPDAWGPFFFIIFCI
jgi:Tfp pilus assembly protein PilF